MIVMSEDEAERLLAAAAAQACEPLPALRLMKHARRARSSRAWHWNWRRLHCLSNMRKDDNGFLQNDFAARVDAGYCLDRYTIDSPSEEPQ